MGYAYIKEENIHEGLKSFSEGKHLPLIKQLLIESYSDTFIENQTLIMGFLRQLEKTNETSEFIEFLMERRFNFFTPLQSPENISNKKALNDFWGMELKDNYPFFLFLGPYLKEEDLSKIIKNYDFFNIDNDVKQEICNPLVVSLMKKSWNTCLTNLNEEYFFISNLDRYENLYVNPSDPDGEKINLERFFFKATIDNPSLINNYTKIFYNTLEQTAEKWFFHHLEQDKQNIPLIKNFLDTVLPELNQEGKEMIIAQTLYKTENLDLFKHASAKVGATSLKDYSPTTIPVWKYSQEHKNNFIFRKLLANGVDVFDYNSRNNKVFLLSILDSTHPREIKDQLNSLKIPFESLVPRLFEEKIDNHNNTTNPFSILLGTADSKINPILNLTLEDLSHKSKKFKAERYQELSINEKLQLLSDILEETFLKPVYVNTDFYYRSVQNKKINLNLWINNDYYLNDPIHLIEEHLNLLSQANDKTFEKYKYMTAKYFPALETMFEYYSVQNIRKDTPIYNMYIKMIDFVSIDKNLDWNNVLTHVQKTYEKKDSLSEGANSILSYLNKISLSYQIQQQAPKEKPKLKI